MTNRRDIIVLGTLFAALVALTLLAAMRGPEDEADPRPTTHASSPGGALALLRWLGDIGYRAGRLEYQAFEIDDESEVLVVLGPSQPFNRTQARETVRWVEAGGTLILADGSSGLFPNPLLAELGLSQKPYEPAPDSGLERMITRAPLLQPLGAPPLHDLLVQADLVLESKTDEAVALAGVPNGTVLLGMRRGEGYVYACSSVYPFTNEGLRDPGNAALVLNLLRRAGSGAWVQFDEFHHGYVSPPSLRGMLQSSPWGWALLYGLAATALYLVLTGRRFGRPVPLAREIARRSSAEYVESLADLLQRGGKRAFVLRHYHGELKRHLARPHGFSPQLDDAAFVAELARHRTIDQAALHNLLARLTRGDLSENNALRLIAEADLLVQKQR